MQLLTSPRFLGFLSVVAIAACVTMTAPAPAQAQVTAYRQAVAEAASRDDAIAEFYRSNDYRPIWTGADDAGMARRQALLDAVAAASDHGLPAQRYDPHALRAMMQAARTPRDLGALEVELSRVFVQFATDIQTGILTPKKVDADIVRKVPLRDRTAYLTNFTQSTPAGFFRKLPPQSPEYARLMREKMRLETILAAGGWGAQVPGTTLRPGENGDGVVRLRNRLMRMGYLTRSATAQYDAKMQAAVQQFQLDHGLDADGVAGPSTVRQVNIEAQERLQSVIVAMERERWINQPLGQRHILVNITDFSARIMDDNKVTFQTRSVVGKNDPARRTPEFSDVMDHMVINPSWFVPRSIATGEYLPLLQRNRNAVSYMEITDRNGRRVNRANVNFANYTARTFPFSMRQPPSSRNALGLVKFMFPNKYNIYLHDTPAKNLFSHETRDYSHGCIRLADPFDFAYTLLARQSDDPVGFFQSHLRSGAESRVNLTDPVQVHIIYRTAFTVAKGKTNYRADVYGRDANIWRALAREGVALRAGQV